MNPAIPCILLLVVGAYAMGVVWRRRREVRRAAFMAALVLCLLVEGVASALTYLSFFPADQGTFAPLGATNVSFTADSNHTASQAEYGGQALLVTSTVALTAQRNLYLPCIQGETKIVTDVTDGGQSIAAACALADGGPAGTVAVVPAGEQNTTTVISPDGVNYVTAGGGAGFDAASIFPVTVGHGGTGTGTAPTAGQLLIAPGTTSEVPTTVTGDVLFSTLTPGAAAVTAIQGNAVMSGIPSAAGNMLVWDGGNYAPGPLNLAGGAGYVSGTLPYNYGGTSTGAAPSEGQLLIASSPTAYTPTTMSGDLFCSTTTPGQCIVVQITGDGGTNAFGGTGELPILPGEVTVAFGTNDPVSSITLPTSNFVDAGAWATVAGPYPGDSGTITANSWQAWTVEVFAPDFSGDGGVTAMPNFVDCNLKFFVFVAWNGMVQLIPANGTGAMTTGLYPSLTLTCAGPSAQTGCTNALGDAGCVNSSSAGAMTFQVVTYDGGAGYQLLVQAQGVFQWKATTLVQDIRRKSGSP